MNIKDTDMSKKDKKFTWSKANLIVTGSIFIACIIFTVYTY